jgi:hypothetical protein
MKLVVLNWLVTSPEQRIAAGFKVQIGRRRFLSKI